MYIQKLECRTEIHARIAYAAIYVFSEVLTQVKKMDTLKSWLCLLYLLTLRNEALGKWRATGYQTHIVVQSLAVSLCTWHGF